MLLFITSKSFNVCYSIKINENVLATIDQISKLKINNTLDIISCL